MDVSPAKRSYFTCANVWWKLLFHSTVLPDGQAVRLHFPAIVIQKQYSGSHMTKVTCSSVALSDKAKYRRIRL